jgi:hypothetical protein
VKEHILQKLKEHYYKLLSEWGLLRSHQNRNDINASTPYNVLQSQSPIDLQTQFSEAIKLRCKVEINYKGEGPRIVCPHAIYNRSGKTLLDSYQTAGYSSHSKKLPYWRPFDISQIVDLKILNETFNTAPGYNPLSNKYSNAIVKI